MPTWAFGPKNANPALIVCEPLWPREEASEPQKESQRGEHLGRPGEDPPRPADLWWLSKKDAVVLKNGCFSFFFLLQKGNGEKWLFQALQKPKLDAEYLGQHRRPGLPALCPLGRPHSTDVSAEEARLGETY